VGERGLCERQPGRVGRDVEDLPVEPGTRSQHARGDGFRAGRGRRRRRAAEARREVARRRAETAAQVEHMLVLPEDAARREVLDRDERRAAPMIEVEEGPRARRRSGDGQAARDVDDRVPRARQRAASSSAGHAPRHCHRLRAAARCS
jgi:hypothetical protein